MTICAEGPAYRLGSSAGLAVCAGAGAGVSCVGSAIRTFLLELASAVSPCGLRSRFLSLSPEAGMAAEAMKDSASGTALTAYAAF